MACAAFGAMTCKYGFHMFLPMLQEQGAADRLMAGSSASMTGSSAGEKFVRTWNSNFIGVESRRGAVMKGMLKWPLIIAACLVVARVMLERAGAPNAVNNIFSVVVFYVLIAPLYFAIRIAK